MKLYHVSSAGVTTLETLHPRPGRDPNSILGTFFSTCPIEAVDSYANFNFDAGSPLPIQPTGTLFCLEIGEDIETELFVMEGYDALFAPHVRTPQRRGHFQALRNRLMAEGYRGILFDLGEDWSYVVFFHLGGLQPQLVSPGKMNPEWGIQAPFSHP